MHLGAGRRTRGVALDTSGLDSGYGGGYYQPLKRGSYSDQGVARELHRNPDVRVLESLDYLGSAEPPEIPPSWVDPRKWEPSEHHAGDWKRPYDDQVSSNARSRGARYCDWQGPLPPSEQHVHHSRLRGGEELTLPGFGASHPRDGERDAHSGRGGRRGRGDRGGSARGSGGGSAYSDSRSGSRNRSRSGSGSRSGSSGRRRGGRRRGRSRSRSGSRSGSRSRSGSGSRWSGSSGSRSSASSERTKAKAQELKQKVEAAQKQEAAEKQKQGPKRKTRGIDLTDELLPVPDAQGEQQGAALTKAGAKSAKVAPTIPSRRTVDFGQAGRQPTVRVADAPKWKTGKARLKLRQEFNRHEINVKSLMEHYDVNRDGTLEADEFQALLKDQSWWKKKASNYELACIMALADTDEDENISTDEVIYALKVWYAYINMNKSVARLLAPPVSEGPLPNQVLLTEVLTHMNDDHPVSVEEVRHVIESLRFLGATKEHVSMIQMRMAISSWYLNVERDETPAAHLINLAFENTHKKIGTGQINPLGKCFRGRWGDPVTIVGFLVMVAVCVVHPIVQIWVSNKFREQELCFHYITAALRMQGYLTLVWFCGFIWLTTQIECCSAEAKLCRQAAILAFIVLSMLCFAVWLFGVFQVMDSQASRCGLILWQYGNFSFVVMPVIMVLFACMGLPCMYCCEYFHNSAIERSLHEHDHGPLNA